MIMTLELYKKLARPRNFDTESRSRIGHAQIGVA
jgi:hypothetical protein